MSSNVVYRLVMHTTLMHTRSYISMYHCLLQTWSSQCCERIYPEDETGRLVLSHVPLLITQDHPARGAAQIFMEQKR